jgi:hypothetical protein
MDWQRLGTSYERSQPLDSNLDHDIADSNNSVRRFFNLSGRDPQQLHRESDVALNDVCNILQVGHRRGQAQF